MPQVYVEWTAKFTSVVEVDDLDNIDEVQVSMDVDVPENETSEYEADTFEIEGIYKDADCTEEV